MSIKTVEERQTILQSTIATWVRKGYQVQSTTGNQAILTRKKKISLLGTIILSCLTGGLWLIVVAVKLANRKHNTVVLTVDTFGNVQQS